MNIDIVVNANSEVCLFHDEPIEGEFGWVEYDDADQQIHLVNEDGSQHLMMSEIDPSISEYMMNATQILIVQMDGEEPVKGIEVPIVIRKD